MNEKEEVVERLENGKINHLRCSICKKKITEKMEEGDVFGMIFRVTRAKESYRILDDGDIELEDCEEKMSMEFCEECFVKILNESKTLGNLFLIKGKNGEEDYFVY